eukprot:15435855-Alexandrium_andersonii.AAC.1
MALQDTWVPSTTKHVVGDTSFYLTGRQDGEAEDASVGVAVSRSCSLDCKRGPPRERESKGIKCPGDGQE